MNVVCCSHDWHFKVKVHIPFTTIPFNFNPIALRKPKTVCNFGLSECNRVKGKKENE